MLDSELRSILVTNYYSRQQSEPEKRKLISNPPQKNYNREYSYYIPISGLNSANRYKLRICVSGLAVEIESDRP